MCVSAPIYRTVRYPHETVTRRPWPIACGIHDSACQVVVAEKHPHTRQTHKGASTPQTAACKAKPTPQATQQAPTTSNSTATQQGKQGPPPHRSIRALPVWGHKSKQAHRAVQALKPPPPDLRAAVGGAPLAGSLHRWREGARYISARSNIIAPIKAGGGKASCGAQRSSDRGDAGKPAPRCVAACASRALTAISAVAAPSPH